jgi:hypothetical protein
MTLILNGTDNSATTPAVTGTDTDTGIYYPTSNQVAIATNGTQAMLVDASQNVGIGTSSPGYKLDVQSTASSGAPLLANFQAAGGDVQLYVQNGTVKTQVTADATSSASIVGSFSAHPLVIRTSNTERMRIDTSGNVGIGTSSPTQKLMLGSGYIQTGQGVGGGGGVRFPYSSDASGRTWRARSDITGYGDFGLEQSTSQTGDTYATRLLITQAGVLQFNSGYGSAATAYGCRAWCQYNQSATIIGAGNITSITVIGTGDVRLNFATAMVDSNYAAVATTNESGGQPKWCNSTQPSTTDIRIVTFNANQSTGWFEYNSVAVFR